MFRWIVSFFATLGVLFVLVIVALSVMVASISEFVPQDDVDDLPERIVLEVDLVGPLAETAAGDPFAAFLDGGAGGTVLDLVNAIARAERDERVVGLFMDLSEADLDIAEAQELWAAISRFRASGRKTTVFADTFEPVGALSTGYYLATAFETVIVQPSGLVELGGVHIDIPLARRILDEYGIKPDFDARHEYKGVAASLTESTLPEPIRQNYTDLVQSLFDRVARDIAGARSLGAASIKAFADGGPMVAAEAQVNGLVDELTYRDAALAMAEDGAQGEAVGLGDYLYAEPEDTDGDSPIVAVVTVAGQIARGGADILDPDTASTGLLRTALTEAREDPDVAAVILRVDSPGGSYVASDSILREVDLTRDSGRPVIVSMADVAASGGYFIALGGDHVLAHPGTVTGSIGVVSGKVVVGEALNRLGVDRAHVGTGSGPPMFSPWEPFTERQADRLGRILDTIYADFTDKVEARRRLSREALDQVARGRVWSGEDARRLGLVDSLGGYAEATALARDAAGIGADETVRLIVYPRPEDPVDLFWRVLEEGDFSEFVRATGEIARMIAYTNRWMEMIAPRLDERGIRAEADALEGRR